MIRRLTVGLLAVGIGFVLAFIATGTAAAGVFR